MFNSIAKDYFEIERLKAYEKLTLKLSCYFYIFEMYENLSCWRKVR
jgi:hypothetical protein